MSAAFRHVSEATFPAASPPAPSHQALAAERSLLRFLTCGSVDDGKSTLLGRMLYETGAVFEDQLEALTRDSARFGTTGKDLDFALLVDGLSAEREQGITIDVAYRYFSTPRRAFIAADTPGHEQYTRNMATGASTADVAIVLVDARKGLLPQTRRHSYIVSMLGVRRVIIAVNKMDLVDFSADVFRAITRDYQALMPALGFAEVHFIPLSARGGDNVTTRSEQTPWYSGPSLLQLLETIETSATGDADLRLPIQWVNRPDLDFRGFSGTIASGMVRTGDPVMILPRGQRTKISRILGASGDISEAHAGEAVTVTLAEEIDVSRGDVIVHAGSRQSPLRTVTARLLALTETPVTPGRTYLAKIGSRLASVRITTLNHAVDVHDYGMHPASDLPMNAIGSASLRFETPVVATTYADCGPLGSLLLIDPFTNEAAALGVIDQAEKSDISLISQEKPTFLPRIGRSLVSLGILPPGATGRDTLQYLLWRLMAGSCIGLATVMLTGSLLAGIIAFLVDAVGRPALKLAFNAVWSRVATRRRGVSNDDLSLDGGNI